MSNLVHGLAFGIPKFYIAPNRKINHQLINMSCNCDVKSDILGPISHHSYNSDEQVSGLFYRNRPM